NFVKAPESRSLVSSSPLMSVHRQPSATVRHTPSPSEWRSGGLSVTKPQYNRSPTKVIQSVLPWSSKNCCVSLVFRVAVPLVLPPARNEFVSSSHFPARHSENLSAVPLPNPNRIMPCSIHSFSHFPASPNFIYRT